MVDFANGGIPVAQLDFANGGVPVGQWLTLPSGGVPVAVGQWLTLVSCTAV
jgi:hypothetical protein